MLVQSTLRSRLPGVFITGESRVPCVFIEEWTNEDTGVGAAIAAGSQEENGTPVYSSLGSRFGCREVILLILMSIQQSLIGLSF